MSAIINGRASITAETAARIATVLGTTAQYWLNLQNAVDLYDAHARLKGAARKPTRLNDSLHLNHRAPRRGTRREQLLNLIRESNGLSRGEILESMGLKGNKIGEMSVSNALTALTKATKVRREGSKNRA